MLVQGLGLGPEGPTPLTPPQTLAGSHRPCLLATAYPMAPRNSSHCNPRPLPTPLYWPPLTPLFPSDMPKQLFASGLDPHKTPTSAVARGGRQGATERAQQQHAAPHEQRSRHAAAARYPIASGRSAAKGTDSSRSLKFPVVSPQNAKAYKSGEVPDALGVRRVNSFFSLRGLAVSKQSTSMLQRKALSFRQQR